MSALNLKELTVDVVEVGARRRKGMVACRLGKHINFDIEALESFSSIKWEATVYDALVVAAAIEFCDRSLSRSTMNWGRKFSLHIPVHEPAKWNSANVKNALVAALNLLTGDDWHFDFRALKVSAERPKQDRMKFPSNAEAVIAYSDGMDSRAVAGLEGQRLGNRLVRVRVGNKQHDISRADRRKLPFAALPYNVKTESGRNAENSARSRGFKFSVVSTVAAYLIDVRSVIVPESGQGALAPALLPVGQGYEDYRSHPIFTSLMERFFHALLGCDIQYKYPRLWMTKGETLREFVDVCGNDANWANTRSCWQQSRQVSVAHKRRQCGVCAACMLRRLSVHAAGLSERSENYIWESLNAPTWEDGVTKGFTDFTPALREYSIAGVLHFEHFSLLRDSMQYELIKRRGVSELALALGASITDVTKNFDRLLHQHSIEWSAFSDNLGPDSFVQQWIKGAS